MLRTGKKATQQDDLNSVADTVAAYFADRAPANYVVTDPDIELDPAGADMLDLYDAILAASAEVDVGYKQEKGRRIVGGNGDDEGHAWMELLGRGMVNRRVIANCGLDPDVWQGFAFGVGVDRLAMLKYGMDDLRAFFDGDLRWLAHYGFNALSVPTLSGGISA